VPTGGKSQEKKCDVSDHNFGAICQMRQPGDNRSTGGRPEEGQDVRCGNSGDDEKAWPARRLMGKVKHGECAVARVVAGLSHPDSVRYR
jgi:hypothetical protein